MTARRDLVLRALEARDGDELSPEDIADVVEDAIRDLPAVPFLAVLRVDEPPDRDTFRHLSARLEAEGAILTLAFARDVELHLLTDEDLLLIGLRRITDVVHRVPPDGAAVTPCCGRTPFELPRDEKVTSDDALVTCRRVP